MGSEPIPAIPSTANFSELAAVAETNGISSMPNMQNFGNSGRIVHAVFNSQRDASYATTNPLQRPMPELYNIFRRPNEVKMHNFHHI